MLKKSVKNRKMLEDEITEVLSWLEDKSPDEATYGEAIKNLEKLYLIKKGSWVNSDVIVSGCVSLLGVLLIMNHERVNVITTKALSFVPKIGRV